jgi:Putative phage serine protease XkdF
MDKNEKRELRELIIEDELGNVIGDLSLISFVQSPAMQQDYMLFSADNFQLSTVDEDKQIVTGVAMRVGYKVLRQDPNTGELFDGVFSEKQVKTCSEIFLTNNRHTQTNLEHGKLLTQNEIDGVKVVESWIVEDPANDKANALGFSDINKGDWYVSFKIQNKAFWEFLKEYGGGFSIEGRFHQIVKTQLSQLDLESEIKSIAFSTDLDDNQKEIKIKELLGLNKA